MSEIAHRAKSFRKSLIDSKVVAAGHFLTSEERRREASQRSQREDGRIVDGLEAAADLERQGPGEPGPDLYVAGIQYNGDDRRDDAEGQDRREALPE